MVAAWGKRRGATSPRPTRRQDKGYETARRGHERQEPAARPGADPGSALRDGPGPRPRPAGGTTPPHRQGHPLAGGHRRRPWRRTSRSDVSDVAETSAPAWRTATGTSASSSPTCRAGRSTTRSAPRPTLSTGSHCLTPALGSRRLRRRVRQAVAGAVRHRPRRTKSLWFPRRRPSGARGGIQARALRGARAAHVHLVLGGVPRDPAREPPRHPDPDARACPAPWRTSSPPRPSGSSTARPGRSSPLSPWTSATCRILTVPRAIAETLRCRSGAKRWRGTCTGPLLRGGSTVPEDASALEVCDEC